MKFFYPLVVGSLVLLNGCATSQPDPITMYLLSNRIKQLEETKKIEKQKVLVEIEVQDSLGSNIVNMGQGSRKVTIEAIIDEDGRIILPPEKITRKFELKSEK